MTAESLFLVLISAATTADPARTDASRYVIFKVTSSGSLDCPRTDHGGVSQKVISLSLADRVVEFFQHRYHVFPNFAFLRR